MNGHIVTKSGIVKDRGVGSVELADWEDMFCVRAEDELAGLRKSVLSIPVLSSLRMIFICDSWYGIGRTKVHNANEAIDGQIPYPHSGPSIGFESE